MADVIRCKDWRGRVVVLTHQRWNDVVLPRRPELSGRIALIQEAVERSSFVTRSADDPQWLYYYLRRGPVQQPHLLLRVEVLFRREGPVSSVTGSLMDAVFITGPFSREGERLLWTPNL